MMYFALNVYHVSCELKLQITIAYSNILTNHLGTIAFRN